MHDGKFRLKTFIGGILSAIIFSIILIYLFILILMPIKLVSNNAAFTAFINNTIISNSTGSQVTNGTFTTNSSITWTSTIDSVTINKHNYRLDDSVDIIPLYPYWSFGIRFVDSSVNPNIVQFNAYAYLYDGSEKITNISLVNCYGNTNLLSFEYSYLFLCPNSSIYMKRDGSNYNHQSLIVGIDRCTNSSSCASNDTIANFTNTQSVNIVTLNSYYDNSNRSNPVQFTVDNSYYFDLSQDEYINFQIKQTELHLIDGRIISVFEDGDMRRFKYKNNTFPSNRVGLVEFYFSEKYYKVYERYNYQPVFSRNMNEDGQVISNSSDSNEFSKEFAGNTNSTESSTNTIEDRNKLYALFVMAQIGGLYSFLKLVFGLFMSLILLIY